MGLLRDVIQKCREASLGFPQEIFFGKKEGI
jgi:hypothetical protein